MKKIKILFFHFCLGHGGAEKVLVNLMNNLDPNKYDITLFTLFHHGVNGKHLAQYIKWIYWLDRAPFRGVVFLLKLFSPSCLHKFFIKDTYDIEIAFMQGIPTRVVSACANPKTKKYAWLHNEVKSIKQISSVYRCAEESYFAYHQFDKIAGVSDIVCESFCKQLNVFDIKPVTIHNTLEIDKIVSKSTLPISEKLSTTVINLCSVGRLVPQKAYFRLMNVFSKIVDEGITNFHFYLLGEGILKNKLVQQVKDLHFEEYVTLLGYDENPYRYVSKMDFFVCSSLQEGYSTAVTESIVVQTPVLTTDCSGMREIFGDTDAGIIVQNSENGLFNGLRKILKDKNLRDRSKQAAILRSGYFSTKNLIAEFESFIGIGNE